MQRNVIIMFSSILVLGIFLFNNFGADNSSLSLPKVVNNGSFVVLELFTSLSCSSCPDAEKHLAEVQKIADKEGLPVYPISFHVDYWNHLGWVDKFSNEIYSERQQQYSRVFKKYNIYTPQMVVNGQFEFVGSNRSLCEKKIAGFLDNKPETNTQIEATFEHLNDTIKIKYDINKFNSGYVNFALVENSREIEVKSGENAGKKIKCINIVRAFKQKNSLEKSGTILFKCPPDIDRNNMHILVYLQNKVDMRVRGATLAKLI
ncbi:MAG: DUF1223 domain-containing protein [Calditrichaeota bacterium]|nr:DUF1223 domain-containing protein [Calditrichota bacterium]